MHEPEGLTLTGHLAELDKVTDWSPALMVATCRVLLDSGNRVAFERLQTIVSLRDDILPPARAHVERFLYSLAPAEVCAFWDEATAYAAAVGAPSLAVLLGDRERWQSATQIAAADWLAVHATPKQALDLAKAAGHPEVAESAATWPQAYWAADVALDLTALVSPPKLLLAWQAVAGGQPATGPPPAQTIREWAKGQGLQVAERGRISQDLQNQYDVAIGR